MTLRVTILGCGSSGGVPRVPQGWGVCDPTNPRNRRRRCSILVEQIGPEGTTGVLVDTSPDLREQLIDAGVKHLDGILMTHSHADHTNGIDDVRPLVIHMKRRLDIHMDDYTSGIVRRAFGYIFETPEGSNYPPLLIEHVKQIYSESEEHLRGLDLWIIDALRHTTHPTHFSIPDALEMIRHFKPKRAILTNLSSEVDYAQLAAEVPDNVTVAYDMLSVEF